MIPGAEDLMTRVAAEWWYLRFTMDGDWTHGMHMPVIPEEDGAHFSVHEMVAASGERRRIFFRTLLLGGAS
ncbi:MAG: hypothetical protein ACRD1E_10365 [Terriglobales bacterium]